MYSPKIQEDLVSGIYRLAKRPGRPMTRVVDASLRQDRVLAAHARPGIQTQETVSGYGPRKRQEEIGVDELKALLSGKRIILDCGHQATPGHNFANTIIIVSHGGGKLETFCSDCGY